MLKFLSFCTIVSTFFFCNADSDNAPLQLEQSICIVDTINYWHILIDNKTVLRANRYSNDDELNLYFEPTEVPTEITFDYRTDNGFEYCVDRIIEIRDRNNSILNHIESSTYAYGETTNIPIGLLLKEHKELIITCKFYISDRRLQNKQTFYNKRRIEKYRDKEKSKTFVICNLKTK